MKRGIKRVGDAKKTEDGKVISPLIALVNQEITRHHKQRILKVIILT